MPTVVVVLFAIAVGHAVLLQSDLSNDLMVRATADVLLNSFKHNVNTIYISSFLTKKWDNSIGDVLLRTDELLCVVIDSFKEPQEIKAKQRYNVILIDSWQSVTLFLPQLNRKRFDFTGFYLILLLSDTDCHEISTSFLKLMAYRLIYNVNVLYYLDELVILNTYFPYGFPENQTAHLVHWNTYSNAGFMLQRSHYPRKLDNFYGAPLRVALFRTMPFMDFIYDANNKIIDYVGIDGSLLKTISKALNFTISPLELPRSLRWGTLSSNGSATGAMGLLMNGTVNLTLSFFGNNRLRMQYMSGTQSYYQTSLVMIVSPGSEYGSFEKLLLPCQFNLWFCFTVALLIGTVTIAILRCFPVSVQYFVYGQDNRNPLLNLFQSTLGNPVIPGPSHNFARFLLTLWIMTTFTLRSAYQQLMFYNFHHQRNHSTVHGWDDFINANYQIFATPPEVYLFDGLSDQIKARLTVIPVADSADILQTVRHGNVRGARIGYPESIFYLNQQAFTDGGRFYRQFNERLYSYSISVFFRKDSPLVEPFDQEILRLVTHGFVQHWAQVQLDRNLAVAIKARNRLARTGPLTIGMLAGMFGVYAVGVICAGFAFLVELCVKAFRK